jgi:hypothetical protein
MLDVITLIAIMLSAIVLSVFMVSVMVPFFSLQVSSIIKLFSMFKYRSD